MKRGFDGDDKDLNYCDKSIYCDIPRFDIGVRTLVERTVLKRQVYRILLEPASLQNIYLQEISMHDYRIQYEVLENTTRLIYHIQIPFYEL